MSITDDDDPAVTVSFEQGSYSVAEGSTESIKLVLSADPERTVTIPILKANQNGASAADYSVPSQVVFNSGDTEKTIAFAAVDDTVDDDGESVELSLGALPAGVTDGTHDSAVVAIVDDDDPAVTVSFEQGSYSVAEGSTESIKLVLSADPERTVTVPILPVSHGGATSADYSVPSQVVFNSGDTEKTIDFAAVDDSIDDDGESVELWLGTLPPGVTDGTHDSTVVSIVDDDTAALTLSRNSVPVDEGDSATFTVKLATQPTANVVVAAVSRDTSAVSVTTGASLTFTTSNWDTAQTVTVFGVEDPDAIDTSAVVDLQAAGGGYNSVSRAVTVSVNDDDSSGLVLSRRSVPVDEGDSATFTVELATQPTANVVVTAVSRDTSTVSVTSGASLTFTTSNWDTRPDGDGVRGRGQRRGRRDDGGGPRRHRRRLQRPRHHRDRQRHRRRRPGGDRQLRAGHLQRGRGGFGVDQTDAVGRPRTHRDRSRFCKVNQNGASARADYSVPSQVVFSSGDTEKTIDVRRGR